MRFTIKCGPRVPWNVFDQVCSFGLEVSVFLLQYACSDLLSQYACCGVQYGCNMHIAMQYGFFSSKSEGFRRSLNFFAICILRVACILR